MKTTRILTFIGALALVSAGALGQSTEAESSEDTTGQAFGAAVESTKAELRAALEELAALRAQLADEKIPLNNRLNELQAELLEVRDRYQEVSRSLESRLLQISNLQGRIKERQDEANYLSTQLGSYVRNFDSRLHISEKQLYDELLEEALRAPDNPNLSERARFEVQAGVISQSLHRLDDLLGGTTFGGTAIDADGRLKDGTFMLVGPAAFFRSDDGALVGTVEQRINSNEPAVIPFKNPEVRATADQVMIAGSGTLPYDPTLGNAHVIETTEDTLFEHVQKGGPVMVPIFALAAAALLVALYKWLTFLFIRKPSKKRINELLDAVARGNRGEAERAAGHVRGPTGAMLRIGVEHIEEPRELIEEVMYEKVLSTRLKLNRMLPFIAISAAAAPLLGLLGTVTGIISTFELITLFGTGDVKTLSGGISEALITTKFGLIVAIPSLLLHAFLARRARGAIDQMEKAAVVFTNEVSKTRSEKVALRPRRPRPEVDDSDREQVKDILVELLSPAREHVSGGSKDDVKEAEPAAAPAS